MPDFNPVQLFPRNGDFWFYVKLVIVKVALLMLGAYVANFFHQRKLDREQARASVYYGPPIRVSPTIFSLPSNYGSNIQSLQDNFEQGRRREFIRQMAKEAWNGYAKYAWGEDELRPMTGDAAIGVPEAGLTIVSAMSTLWIMKLTEEFDQGKRWIREKFNFSEIAHEIEVQSVVNEYIGAFLSCYALTQDGLFLVKARQVAQAIEPAYKSPTGNS